MSGPGGALKWSKLKAISHASKGGHGPGWPAGCPSPARARYGPGPLAVTWVVGLARLEILDFGPGPARAMDKFPTISVRPGTARVWWATGLARPVFHFSPRAWPVVRPSTARGQLYTLLDVHGTRASNVVGWLEGTWDGILSTPTALNGIKNNFYDRFGAFPWVHYKIINEWFDVILRQIQMVWRSLDAL